MTNVERNDIFAEGDGVVNPPIEIIGCTVVILLSLVIGIKVGACFGVVVFLVMIPVFFKWTNFMYARYQKKLRAKLYQLAGCEPLDPEFLFPDRLFGLSQSGSEFEYFQSGVGTQKVSVENVTKISVQNEWIIENEDLRNIEWPTRNHPTNLEDKNIYSAASITIRMFQTGTVEFGRLYFGRDERAERVLALFTKKCKNCKLEVIDLFPD